MWSIVKTDSNIPESSESSETSKTSVDSENSEVSEPSKLSENTVEFQEPPKIAVKRFVKIANNTFNLCYVQPNPLPAHIEWLQKLNTEGLDFVKIPINNKYEMLYIRKSINCLLKQTNIQWDYIDEVINNYQNNESDENRETLLNVVQVAINFCKRKNIEFLIEPVEMD